MVTLLYRMKWNMETAWRELKLNVLVDQAAGQMSSVSLMIWHLMQWGWSVSACRDYGVTSSPVCSGRDDTKQASQSFPSTAFLSGSNSPCRECWVTWLDSSIWLREQHFYISSGFKGWNVCLMQFWTVPREHQPLSIPRKSVAGVRSSFSSSRCWSVPWEQVS